MVVAVEKPLNFLGCDENRRSTRTPRSSAASVVRKSVESVPSVYSPMGGGGVMPAFSNLPSAASSAAYFQNLSSQYAPSLFGSTTLGSAAYGLGQGEVNGAVNAWNYVSSNAPALVEHPSAFLPGIAQGGANLINSAENFAIGAGNSLISVLNLPDQAGNGIAWLVGSGATPFTIIPQVPYATWSNNLFVQNDPAHNVEMALNTAGLTGLSFGSTAILEMAGYVNNAGNLVDSSAIAGETTGPQLIGSFTAPENLTFGTTSFGNFAHGATADLLQKLYPDVNFELRVLPGQTGADVTVPEKFINDVGFQFGEIKPLTTSGEGSFDRQVLNWNLPAPVQPITYDAFGNVYLGFH